MEGVDEEVSESEKGEEEGGLHFICQRASLNALPVPVAKSGLKIQLAAGDVWSKTRCLIFWFCEFCWDVPRGNQTFEGVLIFGGLKMEVFRQLEIVKKRQ